MSERLIDWLFGVIARPGETLNEIAAEKPVGLAFLVYLVVAALNAVTNTYNNQSMDAIDELMFEVGFYLAPSWFVIGALFFSVISIFISTLLIHLFARLFGGRAGYWNMFSAYAFAVFPLIIGVPTTVFLGFAGVFGSVISGLVTFGLAIWVLVLEVIAIREAHGISTGMSILAYFIHLIILIVIPVAIAVFVVLAILAF